MKKVILDCDPGHDDAFAIMLTTKHLDLLGVTTVSGNCTIENATRNALKVLEVIERTDIPVYRGYSTPLVKKLETSPDFHGENGMEGPELPKPGIRAKKEHAVNFIVETVMNNEDITLIATGPLTNIAGAINKEPKVVDRVNEIYIMGGSVTFGNRTPVAEFNIFVDPEAASRVFNSGVLVKMTGINLTRQCLITETEKVEFREIGNDAGIFAAELLDFFIESHSKVDIPGAILHDACAVTWLINPDLISSAPMHIDVELSGDLTRGMTVCDYRHLRTSDPGVDLNRTPTMDFRGKKPNAEAALELDFEGFLSLVKETLSSYNKNEVG